MMMQFELNYIEKDKNNLRASEPADLQFWGTLFFDPSFFGLNQ